MAFAMRTYVRIGLLRSKQRDK